MPAPAEKVIPNYTYDRLNQLRTSPLLPSLRIFRCASIPTSSPPILLFLSPSLQLVEFSGISGDDALLVRVFLSALVIEAPKLKHIILQGQLSEHALRFVPDFRFLRSVELLQSDQPQSILSLECIRSLPHLKNLTAVLRGATPRNGTGFRQLKNLHLTGNPEVLSSIIEGVAASQVESVSLALSSSAIRLSGGGGGGKKDRGYSKHHGGRPPLTRRHLLTECLALICARWSNSICSVAIEHVPDSDCDDAVCLDDLAPLLGLPNLQTLQLRNMRLSFSASEIERVAQAWTKLTLLRLPFFTTLSILDIRCLVLNCPHLTYFETSLKTRVPALPSIGSQPRSNHGLETLSVGGIESIMDASLVARHLDRVFPHLKSMEVHGDYSDQWRGIWRLVQMCQAVRLETLEWARAKVIEVEGTA